MDAAAGVTYIRFFPQIKARYDYGLLVFILTFCMVSLASYRDQEILDIAQKRVITILIGGLISVLICIFVYPIWAGDDLHNLVSTNIGKLGTFLEGTYKPLGFDFYLGMQNLQDFKYTYMSV